MSAPSDAPPKPPPTEATGADRREDYRAPIELKVEYRRLNSFFADYTRNISKGGTFIATARPLPVDTEFVFKLQVPALAAPLELRGRVSWIVEAEAASEQQPAGMGIRFQYADAQERAGVHHTVEQLMASSLGASLSQQLLAESDAQEPSGGAGRPRS